MRNISKNNEKYFIPNFQDSQVLCRYYYDIKKISKYTYGYYGKTNEELIDLYHSEKNPIQKNKIRNVIVNKNLNFVLMIAKRYSTDIKLLPDIIDVGNIGLIKSINKFKRKVGTKLITCSIWWVRMEIINFLDENNLINVNNSQKLVKKKIQEIETNFINEYGITPTLNQIAEIYNELYDTNLNEIGIIGVNTVGIDSPIYNGSENEAFTLLDVLNDDSLDYSEKNDKRQYNKEFSKYLLSKLNKREKLVITKYFGLNNQEPVSEENIALELNLTEVRIQQIRNSALEKLKKFSLLEYI